ncbi:hypothetical protein AgCh_026583 [Apium graveolens]
MLLGLSSKCPTWIRVQEEGWVVCRAFKKPTPNQRHQENEHWNNGQYFRNYNSCQDMLNPMHAALLNQSTNYNYQVPVHNNLDQKEFINQTHRFDHELTDLPHLDSPSTVSTSLDPDQDMISNHVSNYNDMINVHDFYMPKVIDQPDALFSFPDMPLIPCDEELESQNQFLGCFPDL